MGKRSLLAYDWKDLRSSKREYLLRTHFAEDESGRTLYVPAGTRGLVRWSRGKYVVPSMEVRDRIVEAHARWSFRMTCLIAAVVGLAATAFALRPQLAIRLAGYPPWPLLVVLLALAWTATLAPAWIALREAGPLERAPAR